MAKRIRQDKDRVREAERISGRHGTELTKTGKTGAVRTSGNEVSHQLGLTGSEAIQLYKANRQ